MESFHSLLILLEITLNTWWYTSLKKEFLNNFIYLTQPAEEAAFESSSGIDASSAHSLISVSWIPSPQVIPPAT